MTATHWSHAHPVAICAGAGSIEQLASLAPASGGLLLVTTAGFVKRGVVDRLQRLLPGRLLDVYAEVTPNPDVDDLDAAHARYSIQNYTAVIGLGGGSVLDAAKVLSVTLPRQPDRPLARAFREDEPQDWTHHLPVIAIPTTSGTGAEVTPFATVWDHKHFRKHSVTGPSVFPAFALLDPELTLSLPAEDTLYTALDAMSHALESLWNRHRTPISEAYSIQALRLSIKHLPRVIADPGDLVARTALQQASTLAGLAISQTRTAIAHSISYPLTSHHGVPHGLACSFTLERLIQLQLARDPDHPLQALLRSVAALLSTLHLDNRLERYVDQQGLLALADKMYLPGRADNYTGSPDDLQTVLLRHGA